MTEPTAYELKMKAYGEYLEGIRRQWVLLGLPLSKFPEVPLPSQRSPVEGFFMIKLAFLAAWTVARRAVRLCLPVLAAALATHLLTPGASWTDRGLTALRTAFMDGSGACGWVIEKRAEFAAWRNPAPSEYAANLAGSILADDRWEKSGERTVGFSGMPCLSVQVAADDRVVLQTLKPTRSLVLDAADSACVAKAVAERVAAIDARDRQRFLDDTAARLSAGPTEPRPADVAQVVAEVLARSRTAQP